MSDFTSSQKVVRGRLTNARTANFLEFLYNPTEIISQKGVNLSEDNIPGASSPLIHFSSGKAKTISFTLPICGESSIRLRGVNLLNGARPEPIENALDYPISGELDFFQSLEYPVDPSLPGSDGGTDKVLFSFGERYQNVRCAVESVSIKETEWNPDLKPTRATVSLVLKVLADRQEFASSIWKPPLEGLPE